MTTPIDNATFTPSDSTPQQGVHAQHHDELARLVARVYNVLNYGAKGDGVTDDTAAIQAAFTAAAAGGTVHSPPGYTYLISGTLTVAGASTRVDFNGSTIAKKSTMTTGAMLVSGANVTVANLRVDGNRAGGATGHGITWTGAGGVLRSVESSNHVNIGLFVNGGTVTCWDCIASNNVGVFGSTGYGFYVGNAGRFKLYGNCIANSNGLAGIATESNAADGCVVNGTANQNGVYGVSIRSLRGDSTYLHLEDNWLYGLLLDNSQDLSLARYWSFGVVYCVDQGKTAANGIATAVQLWGASYNAFGTIVSKGTPGYALALSGGGTVGSSANRVGVVLADAVEGNGVNPGIIISGGSVSGSQWNSIGHAFVRLHTVAVNIGETTSGGNDFNTIGSLHAVDCAFGVAWFGIGSYNRINEIVSRNCYTSDAIIVGLVSFINTTTTTDNVVCSIDHRTSTGTKPKYIVYAAAGTSRNRVEQIRSRGDYQTNIASIAGTDNVAGPVTSLIPAGAIAETAPRNTVTSNVIAALTTQTLTLVAIHLPAGTKLTSIAFVSGTTAAGTPTNQWFAIYDKNRNLLGVTADDTTTGWAASNIKALNLSAPVTTTYEGLYYLGCMVKATTPPTLQAAPITTTIANIPPILAGTSTAALTNPASAPSTAAAITAFAAVPYAYVA